MDININPIGYVKINLSDEEVKNSLKGVKGRIEILREYQEGLEGIERFSHIIIVAYLHKVHGEQRKVLKVRPRKWVRFGIDISDIPEIGVFCTNSPHRPNPIAITIVRLLNREDNVLYVEGLDLFDGTPVIDIKPYTWSRHIDDIKLPEWYENLMRKIKENLGSTK